MQLVKDLLRQKGHDYVSVGPDTPIRNAIMMMNDRGIGSVIVTDGNQLKGLFTERQMTHKLACDRNASLQTPVSDAMITDVPCVSPSDSIEKCMTLMTDARIRHLPVISEAEIVGIVSIGDLVKAVISEQEFLIKQLENYITS